MGLSMAYLQWLINRELAEETVVPKVVMDKDRARLAFRFDTHTLQTLKGALWLQLAEAVTGDKTYRRCPTCSKWIEFSSEGARADRLFCSNACRNAAYRVRQDKARQLRARGKSFKAIAKELGSDAATVKRWITGVKE